eukprot:TRINITY_DN4538_c0_g2_i2.p2 TRINITY_DN4538_c0_g2~~TRINITY_DN4538_c0_g2_i2.p2  ORF type:complete len:128 (-),score=16.03 TRINITY_DN4538_c0_g2_i2:455-838(-)
MFNQYPLYYSLNSSPYWFNSYVPMQQPQFLAQMNKFFPFNFKPVPAPVPKVIKIDDDCKPAKDESDCQIINEPVPFSQIQVSTKHTSSSKQGDRQIKPGSSNNKGKPGRWTDEEHKRFVDGSLECNR